MDLDIIVELIVLIVLYEIVKIIKKITVYLRNRQTVWVYTHKFNTLRK